MASNEIFVHELFLLESYLFLQSSRQITFERVNIQYLDNLSSSVVQA